MQQITLTALLLLVTPFLFAQQQVNNKLTKDQQTIKGTKVSLLPAKGFTSAVNFNGLQHNESGSSIMVLDMPAPYAEISKAITSEALQAQGITVKTIEQLTINSFPAVLATGTQTAQGTGFIKYMLVFGSSTETIMINGAVPESIKKLGEEVKKCMLSVYYDAAKTIDPFDNLDYSIDVSGTKLKFGKNMSNSLIFTVDGQVPTTADDKSALIVAKSFSPITETDKKQFAQNRLKKTNLNISSVEYVNEITIDGMAGYEIYARGKKQSGETENCYQVILFVDDLYYILFGTTNDATDNTIDDFKKAVKTFKRK